MRNFIKNIFAIWFNFSQPIRFILVGGYNVVIGYGIFISLYYYLNNYTPNWIVLLIASVIGIANNFVVFKVFVFQTKGSWLKECLKTYATYSIVYPINTVMLYFFTDYIFLNTYISQGICVIIIPVITYFLLKRFSFR